MAVTPVHKMNNFKINIFKTAEYNLILTEAAFRSSTGFTNLGDTNICLENPVVDCRIATQTLNQITSGDIVYEFDGITIFNGNGLYYNLALSAWTEFEGTRVCLINTDGTINVDTICM